MRLETKKLPATFEDGRVGEVELQIPVREKSRVCIVGCAGTKEIVPWDMPDCEFWGVNNLYGVPLKGAHYDRWFEIHNIWFDKHKNALVRRGGKDFRGQPVPDYLTGLAALNIPVYMQQHWPEAVPNSVPYPLQEVIKWGKEVLGLTHDMARYLTNTISLEIALAICEGFKEIMIYGVDMAVGTEYERQKPSCEFWLGIAAGLGIKIFIPDEADLLKARFIYGFEEPKNKAFHNKIDMITKSMEEKLNACNQRMSQDEKAQQQYLGAIHAAREIKKIWTNFDDYLA